MRLDTDKKTVGIVCEYNPFHLGHAWMIEKLRAEGADCVLCVMSGPFVQRAEAAMFQTFLRARAAVLGGADLVFRLPLSWAIASAEGFAYGAVGLLSALGCVDEVAFGAETADTNPLCQVAALLESEAFRDSLQGKLSGGESFAAARAKAAEALMPGAKDLLSTPNNILGVEYCKALHRGFPSLALPAERKLPQPHALERKGAQHDGVPHAGIASASWLRGQAGQSGASAFEGFVPNKCHTLYQKAWAEGAYASAERYEMLILSRLRGMPVSQIATCPGAGEGLEVRVAKAAVSAVNLQELYMSAKSKRFAHSRVRRLVLAAALGVQPVQGEIPPFLQLLAASPKGLAVLRENKGHALLPLGTSLAKLSKTSERAARVVRQEALAEDLHALCLQKPKAGASAFTNPLQIVPSAMS